MRKLFVTSLPASLFVVFLATILWTCGGGGGGGGEVTPPSQSLTGTYRLIGFTIAYSDGSTFTEYDFSGWSGTLIIDDPTWTESIVIQGMSAHITGTATITWTTPNTEGIAHLTDPSGTHDVQFTISGNEFDTYSGVMESTIPGTTFEEWNYWIKVSNSISSASVRSMHQQEDQTTRTDAFWIGDLISSGGVLY